MHVHTHGWESSGFQTDVQWQHLKTAGDLGQWATHVSCIHLCRVFLSPPFCLLFFPDLSITNSASCRSGVTGGPCKHSPEKDRQVRKLIVVQDTSAKAQRHSSYTLPASPPLHHLASLWGALSHSFLSKLLFVPLLTLLENQGACKISVATLEKFPQYWFCLENSAGSPAATPAVARLKRTSLATSYYLLLTWIHFYVWRMLCWGF